jgi:type I restriction enzyme M protein
MSSFPDQIRSLRVKLNLSQEELASRLGVAFATVNRWESGGVKPQRAQAAAIEKLIEESGLDADSVAFEAGAESVGYAAARKGSPVDVGSVLIEPSTRRRRGVSKSSVLSTKSMEQMLWDAACSIRGEKDAPKFKDYILPLLFIKRLSDVFDDEVQRLSETYGDRVTALAIRQSESCAFIFLPRRVGRWSVVGKNSVGPRDRNQNPWANNSPPPSATL